MCMNLEALHPFVRRRAEDTGLAASRMRVFTSTRSVANGGWHIRRRISPCAINELINNERAPLREESQVLFILFGSVFRLLVLCGGHDAVLTGKRRVDVHSLFKDRRC